MIKNYQLFKESINSLIQNSGLDVGIVYFILKDIFKEIEVLYYSQINREIIEESKEENSKTIEESSDK